MSTIDGSCRATVYTWHTRVGDHEGEGGTVGHTSLRLTGEDGQSDYLSVRPKYGWSVNPLTVMFSQTATNFSTLDKDCHHEGGAPDCVDTIPLRADQYAAMKARTIRIKEDIDCGNARYTLLPNMPWLPIARALSTERGFEEMSRCPFSGHPMERDSRFEGLKGVLEFQSMHCASSVGSVLNSGGVSIRTSPSIPWSITPTGLRDQLPK